MNIFPRFTISWLPLAISLLAAGAQPTIAAQESSSLIDKVRAATAQFKDINVALKAGWIVATPCVSGPDTGAMGVHLVMPSRLADGILSADQPEALIYEPLPGGAMRLVGVEFIEIAGD